MNEKLGVGSVLIGLAQEEAKKKLARFRFLVSDPLHAHFAQCGSRDLSADHPIPSSLIQSNPVPYSSIQNKTPLYCRCLPRTSFRSSATGLAYDPHLHPRSHSQKKRLLSCASHLHCGPTWESSHGRMNPTERRLLTAGRARMPLDQLRVSC
jgi:hypothetical protein